MTLPCSGDRTERPTYSNLAKHPLTVPDKLFINTVRRYWCAHKTLLLLPLLVPICCFLITSAAILNLWTSTMKLVGILLLTVAATLVVSAVGQDMPMMQNAMKLVLQMCRDVVKSTFSEEVGEMCKKENAHNITNDCFPEMNGKKISCVLNCLGDSAPEGGSSGDSQDEENEALNSLKFVEALMTKKRKMCIMSIMKDCVQEKTGIMLPA